jgi:prolyl-tRNA synthetase
VVIVPIYKGEASIPTLNEACQNLQKRLQQKGIPVKFDSREVQTPGFKFAEWELKGVPVRLALGQRDLENQVVEVARRDTKTKQSVPLQDIENYVISLLEQIQKNLFEQALARRNANTFEVNSYSELKDVLEKGGFALAHWDGTTETELKIKEETKATIRCIPLESKKEQGKCIYSGKPSEQRVVFAIAY